MPVSVVQLLAASQRVIRPGDKFAHDLAHRPVPPALETVEPQRPIEIIEELGLDGDFEEGIRRGVF